MSLLDEQREYLTAHNSLDFIEHVAARLILERPSDAEINQHIYHLLIQEQQQPGSLATSYVQVTTRDDDPDYFSQSSTTNVLEEWIGDLLTQRPEDPLEFSCARFRAKMRLEEPVP